MSSSDSRPLSLVMVMDSVLPDALSGRHVQDAVDVDLEADLDLRHTSGRRRDSAELKLAKQMVVLGHRALALENLDQHSVLIVLVGGEHLRLLGRDEGVTRDQRSHHSSDRLDTESQGGDVEQDNAGGCLLSGQNTALDGSTVGHSLVGVDAAVGLLAVEKVFQQLLDLGDAGGTTDQDNLVQIVLLQLGVGKNRFDRAESLLE